VKYWTIVSPSDNDGTPFYETLSEDEIIDQYWNHWSERMIAKYGVEEFEKNWCKRDCIDDWVVVHCTKERSTWRCLLREG
jgi:hypothetical protein